MERDERWRQGADPRSSGNADEPGPPLSPIARFRSIAEAGYFAEELQQHELPATVRVDEQFDALTGHWNSGFLILVPAPRGEEALHVLQELIDRSEQVTAIDDVPPDIDEFGCREQFDEAIVAPAASDRFDAADHFSSGDESPGSTVPWIPLILTLTAGSAIAWGLRPVDPLVAEQGAAPTEREWIELRSELGTVDRPWTQPTRDGRGVRKLWFDHDLNRVLIEVEPHRRPDAPPAARIITGGAAALDAQ